jgi:hypothetical protein
MRLTSAAKPCCVASLDIMHHFYKASNIGRNDVCTHGSSFVCERQSQTIFGMSYSKEFWECQTLYNHLNSYKKLLLKVSLLCLFF